MQSILNKKYMKKINFICFAIALFTFSCSQAQQTEFQEEALSNTMIDC